LWDSTVIIIIISSSSINATQQHQPLNKLPIGRSEGTDGAFDKLNMKLLRVFLVSDQRKYLRTDTHVCAGTATDERHAAVAS